MGMRGPPEGLNRFAAMYRGASSDIAMDVRDRVAEGDLAGARFVASGTHRGALMGIPLPASGWKSAPSRSTAFPGGRSPKTGPTTTRWA